VLVVQSVLSGNNAGREGGGVATGGSSVTTLEDTSIADNSATGAFNGVGRGGGINNEASLVLRRSTVSGNTTPLGTGAGLRNAGTFTGTNCTISGNAAELAAGGIT